MLAELHADRWRTEFRPRSVSRIGNVLPPVCVFHFRGAKSLVLQTPRNGIPAMSIYRGWRPYPDGVYAQTVQHNASTKALERNTNTPPVHLRRAQPISILLPRTAEWLSAIPDQYRPTALARQFPRIANLICASWPDPAARGKYLIELLTGDGRPNRKGFPPSVLREIEILHQVHLAVSGTAALTEREALRSSR